MAATYPMTIENNGTVNETSGYGFGMFISPPGAHIVNGQSNHSALIEGIENGISGSNATISNFGTIEGLGATYRTGGVSVGEYCAITNGSSVDITALIEGFEGVYGDWSTVSNFGSIDGKGWFGVWSRNGDGSSGVAVTNGSHADTSADIHGQWAGVDVGHSPGTVTNFGMISGETYDGVALLAGGLIRNHGTILATGASSTGIAMSGQVFVYNGSDQDTGALIQGAMSGVQGGRLAETVSNYGTVLATGEAGYGVVLTDSGRIFNGSGQDVAALIQGGAGGVSLRNSRDTIVNFGAVAGGAMGGVRMSGANNVLINGSSTDARALVTGTGPSVVSGTDDTVTNFGTISGLSLTMATDVLRVEAGCVFESPVTDDGTLSLVNGVGTLSGLTGGAVTVSGSMAPATFSGFGTLEIGKAARFTLMGSGEIAAGQTLTDQGVLTVADALVVAGAVTGRGVIGLAAGATAEFDAAAPSSLTVSFKASGTILELKEPSAFGATIAGMVHHGKIDLIDIVADAAVLEAGDKLVITDGGQAVATLQLSGNFGAETFVTGSDGAGGTFISVVRGKGASDPPPAVHGLVAAAASMGAGGGAGHAGLTPHASYERTLLAAPRIQTA